MFTKFASTLGFSTDFECASLKRAALTGDSGVFHPVLSDGGFTSTDKRLTKAQCVKLFTQWSNGEVPSKADKNGKMIKRKPGTSEHYAFMLFGRAALALINDKSATLCLSYDVDFEAAITDHSAAQKALKASKPQTATPEATTAQTATPEATTAQAGTTEATTAQAGTTEATTALELMGESPLQAVTPDPTGMAHAVTDFVKLITAGAFTIKELQYVMDACILQAANEGYTVE